MARMGIRRPMLPNALVLRAYTLRSALLWLGLRGATALTLALAELPPFPRSLGAVHLFIALSLLLCFADVWRRHERVLIGNLGVSPWALGAICLVPAVIGELLLVALLRLIP
jgi:hypothetical protein